ncbi:MAG: hypothetical protein R6V58_05230 [Planctomycetota bacterium]
MAIRKNAKQTEKKWMNCLRCGRSIHTDIYHRLCRRCRRRNREVGGRLGRISSEVSSVIRHGGLDDEW